MPATARGKKPSADKLAALAVLKLTQEEIKHIKELRRLYHKSHDAAEKEEIVQVLVEILAKEKEVPGTISVGEEAKRRVEAYHKSVGREIKKLRRERELTQPELAKLAGIPQSHLSRLETGQHAPTHVTVAKLARALNTAPRMIDPGCDE